MSRIGNKPIAVPAGVEMKIDGHKVTVKGSKGTLECNLHPLMDVKLEGNEVIVTRPNDEIESRELHGLTRTLIHNMIVGLPKDSKRNWKSRASATMQRCRVKI